MSDLIGLSEDAADEADACLSPPSAAAAPVPALVRARRACPSGGQLERDAWAWISEILDADLPGESLCAALRDGSVLCRLANAISPGAVPRYNPPSRQPFKCMDNISKFIQFLRRLGVREEELFCTDDLFERKNEPQVVSSLHALGRALQTTMPDAPLPKLGVRLAERNERVFSEGQLREAANTVPLISLGSSMSLAEHDHKHHRLDHEGGSARARRSSAASAASATKD